MTIRHTPKLSLIAICLLLTSAHILGDTARESLLPVYESTNMERSILNTQDIKAALKALPDWHYKDGKLIKTYNCGSFKQAVAFIVAMSYHCEALDHHPEIFNVYAKVQFSITTYDIGQKVTTHDIRLATMIEETAAVFTFNK